MATFFLVLILRYILPLCVVYIFSAVVRLDLWVRLIWRHRCGLSQVPGPRFARWSRLWITRALASGRAHEIWAEVNAAYGPVARIGPNQVITDDPEITRRILASSSGYRYIYEHPFNPSHIDSSVSDSRLEYDVEKHYKTSATSFPSFIAGFPWGTENTVDDLLLVWLNSLRTCCAKSDETIYDISKSIEFLTIDITTKLLLGREVGCIKQNRDVHGTMRKLDTGNRLWQYLLLAIQLNPLFLYIAKIPYLRRNDFLNSRNGDGRLIRTIRRVADEHASREQIDPQVMDSLAGGLEMTSISLQRTLLCIITNPHVYNTLCAEIRRAVARGNISDPIRDCEAKQCMYLHACVLEGLRRFPPLSELCEYVIPPGGDILGGFILPEGTLVGLNVWGLQLHADVYGGNGKVFSPERWLTEDFDKLHAMHRQHSLMFGHGGTKCLGAPIAMMLIPKVIFEILRHFDVAIADPSQLCHVKSEGPFSQIQTGLQVRLKKIDYTHPPPYEHAMELIN
ncbi:cytochrome P450 oxidoreductase [Nemania sp. FL0031]|nr:cytochrome P450 oxidoreductase [Nemania sp. FL0031]